MMQRAGFRLQTRTRAGCAGFWTAVLAIAGWGLCSSGCGELASEGRAASYPIIERLSGSSGADPSRFNTVLQSDVVTNVKHRRDAEEILVPTVLEDHGQVLMRLGHRDPGTPANPTGSTTVNWITITGYRVIYKRADGRNTPGLDVPYPFDGALTFTIFDVGSATFTLVRAQAKLEPPLLTLRGHGGAMVLSTIADVTFYGRDQAGTGVAITGSIGINFADWTDPP